jgi:serralysin
MALDIGVLQQKYGANMHYRTGNDVYTLPSQNKSGTFYSCIWDAGGTDTIKAGATGAGCTIDLRAATLRYEEGGGGWMSFHSGIHGGFTIAHRVTIENATGGSRNDLLSGNEAANVLKGLAGNDSLSGRAGRDALVGGTGRDILSGGSNKDTFVFTLGTSSIKSRSADAISDWAAIDQIDLPVKGTFTNYREAATTVTSISAAASFAEKMFTSPSVSHVFLYNAARKTSYLVSDLNNDDVFETGVILKSVGSSAGFSYTDII